VAQENQNNDQTKRFDKGINQNVSDYHTPVNSWTFARNSVPSSITGDAGDLGSEPANQLLINAPYTIIGFIYLYADTWAVFSTDDTNSEIGQFVESTSTYTTVVNDSYYVAAGFPTLGFSRANLIIGASKENFDCSWHIYWSDGNNPDRTMNFTSPNWIQKCVDTAGNYQIGNQTPSSPFYPVGCITCNPNVVVAPVPYNGFVLDTNAIRLAPLIRKPI
jgi:hypothetical protein